MILKNNNKIVKKIHFIGIGGISMSALAQYFLAQNYIVSGSDINKNEETKKLQNLGAIIFFSHQKENVIDADLVVYTSAISEDNIELVTAKSLDIKILKRSELLGLIVKEYNFRIGISGSHGKTTTTAMLGKILFDSSKSPTVFLGGEYDDQNYIKGNSDKIIVEACEYRKNFLDLPCNFTAITNIDNDHLDYYKNMDNLKSAFREFAKGKKFINVDDINSQDLIRGAVTFGIENKADYQAKRIKRTKFGTRFLVFYEGKKLTKIEISLKGKYNVYNALLAFAMACELGVEIKDIKESLKTFHNVKRRMERIGVINNIPIYCDYAHHPKELEKSIKANVDKNTLVIFQPHTYSRTKILMNDFITVLKPIKNVIIYKTYRAREKYIKGGSGKNLYRNLIKYKNINIKYISSKEQLKTLILEEINKKNQRYSSIICYGAGDIYEIIKNIYFTYCKMLAKR